MTSDIYMKLLQDVEELLLKHQHGDIAMGLVHLQLYGLQNESDKIDYLRKLKRNHDGTAQKLGIRTAKGVEEIQRHFGDLEQGDE